ncbi:AraC-like DNA-binding protein [Parabacteroides sp. PM5-20]|uniref:AraC family transcriptional regulator n=1 Tax=unclassified Parabacteroides TaxID=2649774 RepID=UPI0013D1F92C|nr:MULTISPECIES: AraC family transcriptional regulator [unclassified Parabacteroides]MDH6535552.1 AraC-like DNA-binding protein [Parabacteroides sp. PM5-20]
MGIKLMHEHINIHSGSPIIAREFDYEHFTYPMHFHSEFEIIYVKEGSGTQYVADSVEKFHPHTLIMTGPDTRHYMDSDPSYKTGNEVLRVKGIIIQFEKNFISYAIQHYEDMSHIKKLFEESKQGIKFSLLPDNPIIRQIESLPETTGIARITSLITLLDLMGKWEAKRLLGSLQFSESYTAFTDYRMKKVISYVSANYKKEISLEEIASLIAMNKSAFCRYFKEKTGNTFMDYLLNLRIGNARQLLLTGSMDVNQISLECGFNSITHFNRIFKRFTGIEDKKRRKAKEGNRLIIKINVRFCL